jgi:Xaa-Pro dipeptidase
LSGGVRSGVLGIDKVWPSQFTIRLMQRRSDVRPVLGSAPVDNARMIKGDDELRLMRESSQMNDEALRRTIQGIKIGMTEKEVGALYLSHAEALGGTGASFEPLVCFGANCAEPHHSSDGTRLQNGDSVILDLGLFWQGYASDMTRTLMIGEPTDEQKRVFDVVLRANAAGRAAVRPGIPMSQIDRAARAVIEEAGYGPYFIHRTGHGIGLEVHEHPDCSATSEVIARPGMVFSIEPGVYLPGRFGVRIEDLVVVTEDGGETLNALEREQA